MHIGAKWELLRRDLRDFLYMCSLLLVARMVCIAVGHCVRKGHAVVAFPNNAI